MVKIEGDTEKLISELEEKLDEIHSEIWYLDDQIRRLQGKSGKKFEMWALDDEIRDLQDQRYKINLQLDQLR